MYPYYMISCYNDTKPHIRTLLFCFLQIDAHVHMQTFTVLPFYGLEIKILTFSVNFQASGNIEKKFIQVFLLLVDAIMDSLNTAYQNDWTSARETWRWYRCWLLIRLYSIDSRVPSPVIDIQPGTPTAGGALRAGIDSVIHWISVCQHLRFPIP